MMQWVSSGMKSDRRAPAKTLKAALALTKTDG
jgi:hypothetical protein